MQETCTRKSPLLKNKNLVSRLSPSVSEKCLFLNQVLRENLNNRPNVVPNSDNPGLRFFVYCTCILLWHSHLNDMEILEKNCVLP